MTSPSSLSTARALLLSCACLAGVIGRPAHAQAPSAARSAGAPGEIRGRITEQGTGRAITSGSVTVRRAADTAFAGGALPKADGSFQVDGLLPGRYTVRVRALGHAPLVRSATVTSAAPVVDLGAIVLTPVTTTLDRQEIVAEREEVALAPDRNSYSTKNMTTASGGTAVDVLRNVPSVEVDGTNNVSLRGNANVVVQINGRSSPLKGEQLGNFLAQLPASAVKNVEVATNPSAKDDPEGTAGIINIVLNQEAELGLSGGVTAGTGTTGMVNLSGNVGKQSGPLTLLLSGSVYRDHRVASGTTSRVNLVAPVPAVVESRSAGSFGPRSGGVTLRSEYRFDKANALSLDAVTYGGRYGGLSTSYYTDLDPAGSVIGLFDQSNENIFHNASQDYTLAFRRTAPPAQAIFSSELRYSTNANTSDIALASLVRQADASTGAATFSPERDRNVGHYPSWNLQVDHTLPFRTGTKLESGFKGTDRHTANDFTASQYDSSSAQFQPIAGRASAFDYREQIGAAYAVLSQPVGRFQLQGGLRLEEAATRLAVPTVTQKYDNHYGSAFPSAIVSFNPTEMRQAKLSYSRRISRPNPFQLSPIDSRDNARALFRGNPGLQPEYTHALELGLQETRGWGSVQVNPYLRRTTNAVQYVQSVDTSGVTLSTFQNLSRTTVVGSDLNITMHTDRLTLFGGGSVYHYSSDASNLPVNLSTSAVSWSARANATWKIGPTLDAQSFVNYRAPTTSEAGRRAAFVFMNAALRYKRWGDDGNISLRVADPFNLMKFGITTTSPQAIEESERHFGQRGVFLTVTRNFGQQLKLKPRQDDPAQAPPSPGGP